MRRRRRDKDDDDDDLPRATPDFSDMFDRLRDRISIIRAPAEPPARERRPTTPVRRRVRRRPDDDDVVGAPFDPEPFEILAESWEDMVHRIERLEDHVFDLEDEVLLL